MGKQHLQKTKKKQKILKVTGRKKTTVNSWAISYNLY